MNDLLTHPLGDRILAATMENRSVHERDTDELLERLGNDISRWFILRLFQMKLSEFLTLVLLAITVIYAHRQWKASDESAKAALRALDLARAAQQKADQNAIDSSKQFQVQLQHFDASLGETENLAKQASRQADAENRLATSSTTQADTARKSEKLIEAQTLAYVAPLAVDLSEPIVPDKWIKIKNVFKNTGGSVAIDVQSLSTSQTIIDGSDPLFDFKQFTGSRSSIAPQGTFDNDEIQLPPMSSSQVAQIYGGIRRVYLTGVIMYKDILRNEHHTYYCFEFDPSTGEGVGCRVSKPSD